MASVSPAGAATFEVAQVLAAAKVASVALHPWSGDEPPKALRGPFLRFSGGRSVFGATAVVRALAATRGGLLSAEQDAWLEWEEFQLRPLLLQGDKSAIAEALTPLQRALEEKDATLLMEDQPTLRHQLPIAVAQAVEVLGEAPTPEIAAFAADMGAFAADLEPFLPPKVDLRGSLESVMTMLMQVGLLLAYPELKGDDVLVAAVQRSRSAKHGDYQCMNAMRILKKLKADGKDVQSGREVAERIKENVPPNEVIADLEVAGPGFINLRVNTAFLRERLGRLLLAEGPIPPRVEKQRILVDFSSPNIAKEMHVGHLRSTIIGDTICRLLEFCGHEVLRTNHVGDWGTQFGMLIKHIFEEYPDLETNPPNITDLTSLYQAAKKKFKEDDDFKTAAREHVVLLQSGDERCHRVWDLLRDISRMEFNKVYTRLDVHLEEYGESFYNPMIPGVVEELQKSGTAEDFEGAVCIFQRPKYEIPLIVVKSDGGYGYDSTDMAALSYRLRDLLCDRCIYVTDAGQAQHFYMCFDAARKSGWTKAAIAGREAGRADAVLEHVGFGVVQGEDGKRFRTSEGESVKLIDLLDAAKDRFAAGLRERVAEGKSQLQEDEIDAAAAKVGYGAVKYFDLKNDPTTAYQFSYDRMLDPRGDTAVYLCYAYARLQSIMRKGLAEKEKDAIAIGKEIGEANGQGLIMEAPQERALVFELLQLEDVVEKTVEDLRTHRICEYLYNLSNVYTDFVTQCHVLNCGDDSLLRSRLVLCKATGDVMKACFHLLGMTPLEKM